MRKGERKIVEGARRKEWLEEDDPIWSSWSRFDYPILGKIRCSSTIVDNKYW